MTDDAPYVVTLALDPAAQAALDALREAWFPPERNHLGAHVTVFHALPAAAGDEVTGELTTAAAQSAPFPAVIGPPVLLGRGVGLPVRCPPAERLRSRLADAFDPWLTRQDRQGWRPHVTVTNKVSPERAREVRDLLLTGQLPEHAEVRGLALWRYRGGPWEPVGTSVFSG